jgi:hypothetical protein
MNLFFFFFILATRLFSLSRPVLQYDQFLHSTLAWSNYTNNGV